MFIPNMTEPMEVQLAVILASDIHIPHYTLTVTVRIISTQTHTSRQFKTFVVMLLQIGQYYSCYLDHRSSVPQWIT